METLGEGWADLEKIHQGINHLQKREKKTLHIPQGDEQSKVRERAIDGDGTRWEKSILTIGR